ncbi:MAG: hypothetical protein HOY79_47095 [Streptomyces sp.]|nr:hypothetical protein [Streptomyces sp.]
MPELIPTERTRFLSAPVAAVVIAAEPGGTVLPPLAFYDTGTAKRVLGWTVVARTTMCVLDGPGQDGMLVPTISDTGQMDRAAAWAEAVADAGGVLALQVARGRLDATVYDLLADAETRGGFVPNLR